jgi:hypothetical protein
MATKSNATVKGALNAMIKGLQAAFGAKAPFTLAGRAYKRDDIVQILQSLLDAIEAVRIAEAQLKGARTVRANVAKRVQPIERALERFLRAVYGADSAKLLTFGVKPERPRKVTIQTKADAVEKGRATRKARGTMGKKQRLKIKAKLPEPA